MKPQGSARRAAGLLVLALFLALFGLPLGALPKGTDLGLAQGGPTLVAKAAAGPAFLLLFGFALGPRGRGRGPVFASRSPRAFSPLRRVRLYLLYARLNLEGG